MKQEKRVAQGAERRVGTGIAEHATTAAFTTSRAITSHMRRRYRERYHGRSPYAPVLFLFDLALLGLATFLVAVNAYLFVAVPAPLEGYRLDLLAPALSSAAPLALEARVSATGDGPRRDVRLRWTFPPGTEILQSEPPVARDGEVHLGTLAPDETLSSRVVVRLFHPQGQVRFGFVIVDADGSIEGEATRTLARSGLRFEPLVPLASVVRDSDVPYLIRNDTSMPLEGVTVAAAPPTSIDGLSELRFARLEPFEERVVSVRPSRTSPIEFLTAVRDVPLVSRVESYALLSDDPVGVQLELEPSGGAELAFRVRADRAASLAVRHPGLRDRDRTRMIDIEPGDQEIVIETDPGAVGTWYVVPFVRMPEGNAIGRVVSSPITTAFSIHASARYFATSGDQIGVGPLPPRVGEPTRVWIGLRLAPTTSELSDLRVRVRLAPGVRVTGRDALPDGGSFSQTDRDLVWNVGTLPADPDGIGAFFEVEIIPAESDFGTVPALVELVRADAFDPRAGTRRESAYGLVDMNLSEDELGKNLGKVE